MRRMTTNKSIQKMIDEAIQRIPKVHLYEHRINPIIEDYDLKKDETYRWGFNFSCLLDKNTKMTFEDLLNLFPLPTDTHKLLSMNGTVITSTKTYQGTITNFQISRGSMVGGYTIFAQFETKEGDLTRIHTMTIRATNADIENDLITDTWLNDYKRRKI